jgi:hypothetical protein
MGRAIESRQGVGGVVVYKDKKTEKVTSTNLKNLNFASSELG